MIHALIRPKLEIWIFRRDCVKLTYEANSQYHHIFIYENTRFQNISTHLFQLSKLVLNFCQTYLKHTLEKRTLYKSDIDLLIVTR